MTFQVIVKVVPPNCRRYIAKYLGEEKSEVAKPQTPQHKATSKDEGTNNLNGSHKDMDQDQKTESTRITLLEIYRKHADARWQLGAGAGQQVDLSTFLTFIYTIR
jgi:hypothetical protein